MTENEINYILHAYLNDKKSSFEISKELKKDPKTIRNVIKKAGYALRSKKEAAETSYKSGRTPPMTGKSHSEETKNKIGKTLHKNWDELSEENYEKRVDTARKTWYNLDSSVREKIIYNSRKALSLVSKNGSKIENSIYNFLNEKGLSPIKHYRGFLNTKLEVDLYLPAQKIALEIDGPSHFVPIYGDEALEKTMKADREKTLTILGSGNVMVRFGFVREISKYDENEYFERILDIITMTSKQFPPEGQRYFEVFYE